MIFLSSCHLLLGEVQTAHQCFNKCMESGIVFCLDRRVIVEAVEALQKAQLQKYDATIHLCEQSQHLAETNFVLANNTVNSDSSLCDSYSSVKLWRWSLKVTCYFHLGRLEASLNVLEKLQQVVKFDEELDAVMLAAQALVYNLKKLNGLNRYVNQDGVDNLQMASLLALFVSDHFGGS
ncbi:hypothetical protein JHK85_007293 [Glycine max]|nr:hypothetical protein JHK85_007293 [Glycine max]